MNQTLNDALSRLISRHVDPRTLAKIFRVERNDIAEWALALTAVPEDLAAPIATLEASAAAGAPIPFEALAWELGALPDDAWRAAIADWRGTVQRLGAAKGGAAA